MEEVQTRMARAREALQQKRDAKKKGELRGAVKQRVEGVESRQRVAALVPAVPDEVLRMVVGSDASMVRACRAACHAWHAVLRVHPCFVFALVCTRMPQSDVLTCGVVCQSMLASTQRMRGLARQYGKARESRARTAAAQAEWLGRRVRVAWEADGPGVAYEGEVLGVRHHGTCCRVLFDVGVGRDRMRAHTIRVDELEHV